MPWDESNPLYRWKMKRGKVKKAKSHTSTVKNMAKRRIGRWRRRHTNSKKIPIAATIGLTSMFLTPGPAGTEGVVSCLMRGDLDGAAYTAREKFVGLDRDGKFHFEWVAASYAPLIAGVAVSAVVGKFANKYFNRIPLIGKYIAC